MIADFNNITVYHGSYTEVQIPDLKNARNLKNQLCFKTEKAIEKLKFVKSEKISL